MSFRGFDRHFGQSLELFVLIPLAAVSMSVISGVVTFHLGVPDTLQEFLKTTTLVALLVSVPMAGLAAQYDLRIRRSNEKLERLASTDPLTGLLNRRSFLSAVSDEMARMRRTGNSAAIAFVDLDRFKQLNDTFGHKFGDEVLCSLAVLLSDELRHPFDKICRWGGEEFVVLTSNVTPDQARGVFERLRRRIENHCFESGSVHTYVTASFGATPVSAMSNLDEAIQSADEALYAAKHGGRNRIVFTSLESDAGAWPLSA